MYWKEECIKERRKEEQEEENKGNEERKRGEEEEWNCNLIISILCDADS